MPVQYLPELYRLSLYSIYSPGLRFKLSGQYFSKLQTAVLPLRKVQCALRAPKKSGNNVYKPTKGGKLLRNLKKRTQIPREAQKIYFRQLNSKPCSLVACSKSPGSSPFSSLRTAFSQISFENDQLWKSFENVDMKFSMSTQRDNSDRNAGIGMTTSQ